MANQEPTPGKVAEACREVLTEEDCDDIAALPLDEAIGQAFTLLIENGVDDPEAFLKEKDILE